MAQKKIAILGGGNLGTAIAKGVAKAKLTSAQNITITRRNLSKIESLEKDDFKLSSDNAAAIKGASIIILCVQPKQVQGLLAEISKAVDPKKHILVSTITGVSIEEIGAALQKKVPIVRAMCNTAIAIGSSMTCMCAKDVTDR